MDFCLSLLASAVFTRNVSNRIFIYTRNESTEPEKVSCYEIIISTKLVVYIVFNNKDQKAITNISL